MWIVRMSSIMNPLGRECMIHERTKVKLAEALAEIERLNKQIETTNGRNHSN